MSSVPTDEQEAPRRTRRGEVRDAQLRARASDLFLARGYDGVSVDDIVRTVGGSKTNVYSFYGGKDGLFLAVMDEISQATVLPLKRLKLGGLSFEAGLRKFARTLLTVLLAERHLAFQRLVIAEALRHPQLGLTWYRNGPALTRSVLKSFLAEHQALGHVRKDVDLTQAAVLFHDMIVGDLLSRAMMAIDGGPKPREVEMTIRQAVKIAKMGLAPNSRDGVP
jgi:AcrR family transcriptional regulator